MSEKLTLGWCFKYPKAKIIHSNRNNIMDRTIYPSLENWILSNPYNFHDVDFGKLILRPPNSLTKKEEIRLMVHRDIKTETRKIRDTTNAIITDEFEIWKVDKLREWNIDIDGLQERGIAEYE